MSKIILSLFFLFLTCTTYAKDTWQLGLALGYSPVYMVNLSGSGIVSGSRYNINYTLLYEAVPSLQLDFRKLGKNGWGLLMGLEYEPARKMTQGIANGLNMTLSSSTTSKYQTNFFHFGTAYRWDIFYLPIGITYGMTTFWSAPASTANVSITNGFGAIIGMGWYVNDNFAIEYVSRSAATTLNFTEGADSELTSGTLAASVLALKYFF